MKEQILVVNNINKMKEKIVVAICTHNRRKYLIDAIKSFKKIREPKFDLIVIDSSDNKLSKKEQKLADYYMHDKTKKALSLKRNIVIIKFKSDILIFTDDDCIATPTWIKELVKEFSDESVACVTGKTIPFKSYEGTEYEKKFSFGKIGNRRKVMQKQFGIQNLWRFGHGNNMAFRTKVFKKVGLFDNNLGVGSKGLRAEDVDMFYRVYKSGYRIIYNPNAVILHKHLTKKEDMEWAAHANGYASKLVLFKNLDLNTFILYFGGIVKLTLKYLFASGFEKEVNMQLLKGWLGAKWKKQ